MIRVVTSDFRRVGVRSIIEEARRALRSEGEKSIAMDSSIHGNQELYQDIQSANQAWQIDLDFPIRSHRRYLGPWIVRVKNVLRRIYRWYFALIVGQIVDFQRHIVHSLNGMENNLEENIVKIQSLSNKIHEKETQLKDIEQWIKRIEAWHLSGRVAILESDIDALKRSSLAKTDNPTPVLSWSYYGFEDKFRGTEKFIKDSQVNFAQYFKNCRNVVDLGCGRGEFLELMRELGIPCKGVDNSPEMVKACRLRGLEVISGDIRDYLRNEKKESLDGIFMAFVIEHLSAQDLIDVIHLCYTCLCKNGKIVIITDNPMCLSVGGGFFWVDLTHIRPVHPETIQFLMQETGFADLRLEYSAPYPPEDRLVELPTNEGRTNESWKELMNSNMRRLNESIYGFRNYSVSAVKR